MKKLFLFLTLALSLEGATPFKVIYHGSPSYFEKAVPKQNIRFDRSGNKIWEKTAIFAAYDMRIPLFYTHSRLEKYKAYIDLEKQHGPEDPIVFELVGGANLEEAVEQPFGPSEGENTGYIYLLDDRYFIQPPELGSMERICLHDNCNIGVAKIQRRNELEYYRQAGSIIINWTSELQSP